VVLSHIGHFLLADRTGNRAPRAKHAAQGQSARRWRARLTLGDGTEIESIKALERVLCEFEINSVRVPPPRCGPDTWKRCSVKYRARRADYISMNTSANSNYSCVTLKRCIIRACPLIRVATQSLRSVLPALGLEDRVLHRAVTVLWCVKVMRALWRGRPNTYLKGDRLP